MLKFALLASLLGMMAGSVIAQAATDESDCQKRAEKIALEVGVPTAPVSAGSFFIPKAKIASIYGECNGMLYVSPDPEPFDVRLSPGYPNLVVRVASLAFDLKPAQVEQAIDACLRAAVPDPPQHSGRAGFARQRWRNSQMTGTIEIRALKWECTYHNSEKSAASITITKTD